MDVGTADLLPGEGATLEAPLSRPGTYALFCDVAYHQQKGMVAVLTVEGPPGGPAGPPEAPPAGP